MILVLLGTNPYPFSRLLDAMARFVAATGERVIAQVGSTPPHAGLECFPYLTHADLLHRIRSADVVVCQGGFGSLWDSLNAGARVVAVPRSPAYGEAVDDQSELVKALAALGLVTAVYDVEELSGAIAIARSQSPRTMGDSRLPIHVANTVARLVAART